jgi:dipeptidyl aminopeptidase/acylaminoacyl peptidase
MRLALLLLLVTPVLDAAVPAPSRSITEPRSLESKGVVDAKAVPIADLFYTRTYAKAAWSPDDRELVVPTTLSGRMNLWKVSATGSWPMQITRSDDAQGGENWSPDGKWIEFASDRAGGEIFDLYAVPASGGDVVNLTATDDISEADASWSRDASLLAYSARAKEASTTNIAVLDFATRKTRLLTSEKTPGYAWSLVAWSNDGRSLYANRQDPSYTDSSIWRIEVASGRAVELTSHRETAKISATHASADEKWLAVTAPRQRGGSTQVALFDLKRHEYRWITNTPWEATSHVFSPDSGALTYQINADGRNDLFIYKIASGESQRIDLPPGTNTFGGRPGSFSHDGSKLIVVHQDSTTPADFWIFDLVSGKGTQLTHAAPASLNPAHLPQSQLVHYKSFDGTVISAFVWIPFGLERNGSAPAVVLPHGGPTSQTLDMFNRTAVALASRGYVCIAPNVRGSSGYGVAFQSANYQDLGGGDLQDTVYAARFLVDTGFVDAGRVGITGASYGGFMALMAIGRTPDKWKAAVDLYGVTNWLTEQEHEEPALQQYDQKLLGDPVKDRAVYERSSPTTYFSAVRAPLLILQGENDIRDPKSEAESAFSALKKTGATVEVHYYPGEGHGFAKRENQIDALERTIAWFAKHL